MRCHNLGRAARQGLGKLIHFFTTPRGQSATGCQKSANLLELISIVLLVLGLTISFYYRNVRRSPRLHNYSELSRFPYETVTLFLIGSYVWLSTTGSRFISLALSAQGRAQMWEGMDLFGGEGQSTIFLIFYFLFLEFLEAYGSLRLLKKRFMESKRKELPVVEVVDEKEVLAVDEKKEEVSIYEAIATTPVPSESDSESDGLLTDSEANTTPVTRLTVMQRIKKWFAARNKLDLRPEAVVGRFYMLAFFKANLIFGFALVANGLTCTLSPEEYFDNKKSNYMLLLFALAMWSVRCAWVIGQALGLARAELKERRSLAL